MRRAYISYAAAIDVLMVQVNQVVASQLKALVEGKHLYQSLAVDFENLCEAISQNLFDDDKTAFERFALLQLSNAFFVPSEQQLSNFATAGTANPRITLFLQNVKLYCSGCGQRETFSPTFYQDASAVVGARNQQGEKRTAPHPIQLQLFVLCYQCETCRKEPVCFLLRREGWKLTIEGRSPFEEVEVPKYIPKQERWLFSDAIVAHQAGKTLAGFFYLRSFIEQFARRQTGIADRMPGDQILEAYQQLLPSSQRDHMPSLRSWYEKLSGAIHNLSQDAALFEEAKTAGSARASG